MWKKCFFFCLLLCCLLPVARSQERYHPISEAELSRLEELSVERAQRLTQALKSIKGLETTLTRLSARQGTLTHLLSQAQTLTTRSWELYVGYVKGSSSIIEEKNERIVALETEMRLWRIATAALGAIILIYIALRVLLRRLKIP